MESLYIISKQEFTSLYRFGQIPLRLNQIIDTINKSIQEINSSVFENFKELASFVGDEEYLIISFLEYNTEKKIISIEQVKEIIPMTKAAKSSLAMKFDNRLDFSEPRFEEVFHKIEEYIDIEERFNGAKAFCKLSKVNDPFHKLVNDDIIINSYYLRLNDENLQIEKSYYTQLLAYERYEFFPNNDLGYYYDAGEVYAHLKGLPTFVGSNFYNYLQSIKDEYSNKSFIEITDAICNADEVKNFTDKLTLNNIREFIVAAIFQKFKSDLRERESIFGSETGKTIKSIKDNKEYIPELNIATYLTGAFFGYKKFYDDLYAKIDLNIFKKVIVNKVNSQKLNDPKQIIPIKTEYNTKDETIIFDSKINNNIADNIDNSESILNKLKLILDKSKNSQIKVEKEILKELQEVFKPLFKNKKPTTKQIMDYIRNEYVNELEIPKKDTISIKKEPKLF